MDEKSREGVAVKCLSCVLLSYPNIKTQLSWLVLYSALYYYGLIIMLLTDQHLISV